MAAKRIRIAFGSRSNAICRACRLSQGLDVIQATTKMRTITTTAAAGNMNIVNSMPSIQGKRTLSFPKTPLDLNPQPQNPFQTDVPVTLYSWPEYLPLETASYPREYLSLPLRRDILHRAVIYEGDRTRQGTASTKTRYEIHGSNRKVRPQKGTGRARIGNKKSPILRGGGVAFGPKPRDFATGLPRKVYDLAWRTALSYRYRRGELVVIKDKAEIERKGPGSAQWLKELFKWYGWGPRAGGSSLIVTEDKRENLWAAMRENQEDLELVSNQFGVVRTMDEVDVKNLLEGKRVIIEHAALQKLFRRHTHDLKTHALLADWREQHSIPTKFRA